ncbi:hypothetical protein H0W91_02805 [Patescibacteria group bacterium]|nr:hypothetical protein [Patescibacteria group bacterium]
MILYTILLLLSLLFSILFIIFMALQIIAAFSTHAPFVPVPDEVLEQIVASLKLSHNSVLYDLGCGNGKVLVEAVLTHPQIKAVGIERAFFPYLLAKLRTRNFQNITIKRANFFETDMSEATHFFTYLYPGLLRKLIPIMQDHTKKEVRVVSCDFESEEHTPVEIVELDNEYLNLGKRLYIYHV